MPALRTNKLLAAELVMYGCVCSSRVLGAIVLHIRVSGKASQRRAKLARAPRHADRFRAAFDCLQQ